jgi:hypothetical protein
LGVIQDMCLDNTDKGREALSKVKHILRKIGARTKDVLIEAMGVALGAVSAQDARGYFVSCGYRTPAQ